jgi:hypothetical protein
LKSIYGEDFISSYRPYLKDIIKEEAAKIIPIPTPASAKEPAGSKTLQPTPTLASTSTVPSLTALRRDTVEVEVPVPRKTAARRPTRRRGKRKQEEEFNLDPQVRALFKRITSSVEQDIITFSGGRMHVIQAEFPEDVVISLATDILQRQAGEDEQTFALRSQIVGKIQAAENLSLTPYSVLLLGYLISKKIVYGVRYDRNTEAVIYMVSQRLD